MRQADTLQHRLKFQVVTEESIRLLVDTFYDAVRKDVVLGPVFENALHGRWSTHMPRMYDFWSTILLGTRKFQGNVYRKHMALTGIANEHFVRWLSLFKNAVTHLYGDGTANEILETADRIAGSLQLGFFGERPVRLWHPYARVLNSKRHGLIPSRKAKVERQHKLARDSR